MSKVKSSLRLLLSRIALFTAIGTFGLIFMVAVTSAAGFTFMDPISAFLGFAGAQTTIVQGQEQEITVGYSYHNDTSPALREMRQVPVKPRPLDDEEGREANENPAIFSNHIDSKDEVVQSFLAPDVMPTPIRNMDGIVFPGVACNCAPPDTNGEVGSTQYVQMVNEGYQIFNKTTGASVLGPSSIVSLWAGFGGVCELNGDGDPIVIYDQLANRWIISQFAGASVPTDECVAVSTTSDATGSYNRYGFHLGSNFFDYPHLSVWPNAYYMSMNVINSAGTAFLGPQPFAFDRAKMLTGVPATVISTGITGGPSENTYLPADLDGSTLPPPNAPGTFVEVPFTNTYRVFHFQPDFVTPANSTFTLFASPAAAPFTELCPTTRACVPQLGSASNLDGIGDRLMYRLTDRFLPGHESLVGNFSVSAGGVSGVRWFELRNVTAGPVSVFQESTYQPDTTWRWLASAAMDQGGNMAVGFSASSAAINPQIRYAGRLAGDPINTLAQGEGTLFAGTGSQTGSGNRWGDYSDLTIDPVDDCTFWYTQEYYSTTSSFNWRTRIGSFKFTQCSSVPTPVIVPGTATLVTESCTPANGAPDPGENVSFTLNLMNGGTGATSNLVATLQASANVLSPSGPQNYGSISVNGTVGRNFSFTAAGNCGDQITITLQLQDGATNLGTVTFTKQLGATVVNTAFSQNFDGVAAPALPAGWTTAATGIEVPWVTSTTNPNSTPNDAFAPDVANIGDTGLVSPTIAVPAGGGQLTFKNLYNMESTFDGMVLEISINGGAFADITAGGGSFVSGGYNGTISTAFGSPIAGRLAWTGLSGGSTAVPTYIVSVANLPPAAAGQNVTLKWRAASDNSVAAAGDAGVRIDNVVVSTSTFVCSNCAVSVSISGTVKYGNAIGNPVPPRFVKNVSVASIVGSPAVGPVITGTPGTYVLTGFGSGAYTIKPTKPGGVNGAITSNDAARVAQGVANSVPFVSQNQRFVSDASGNGSVTSNDAALIARFAAGLTGTGNVGQWKFFVTGAPSPLPTAPQTYNDSRSYPLVTSNLTGEDYVALLVGEASGNWNPATHPRPAGRAGSEDRGASRPITIAAQPVVAAAEKEIVIPVTVEGAAGKEIISYEFNLRYDPAVIQPVEDPVDVTGTVSRGLMVVTNPIEPGLLRVVVYGPMPIDENGVLLNLRFVAVGKAGSVSPVTFDRLMFNEGEYGTTVTDGKIELY